MSQIDAAGQAALITVAVVPARAVYLIAEGSRTGFRRAVQEATTRWGGASEPIVEVRDDGTMLAGDRVVVERANVDGAVNVDAPETPARVVAQSLGLTLTPIAAVDTAGPTMFTSHPAVLVPPTVDGSNGYVISEDDSPLWHAAAAGDLSADQESALDHVLTRVRRARFDYEIGDAQLWEHDLLGRSTVSLGEWWASPAPMDSPMIIWLTRDDALADCLEFWNLRALRPLRQGSLPMILLPEDISSWTSWPEALHRALRRPDHFTPDVMITSTTVDRAGMDTFAQHMSLQRADNQGFRRYLKSGDISMRSAPFTYLTGTPVGCFAFDRKYGELAFVDVPVMRDTNILRFPNPVPIRLAVGGFSVVRVSGAPFDALPRLDCVAKLVSDDAAWRDEAVQLPASLSSDMRLELRMPSLAAAAEAVLNERTRSHTTSQKGAVGMSLLNDTALDALAEPLVYEATTKLTTPRSSAFARTLQRLFTDDHPLTDGQAAFAAQFAGRSEQVYRSAARLGHGTPEAATAALERLVDIGWAERGLETRCTHCGLKRFVPFSAEAARGSGRCSVCESHADYTRTGGELTVHYRLTGRVDHANDQGVVAHLMVIGALRRRHKHVWLSPGTDLVFPNGTVREADLFGICDGQLISGEVKMSGVSFDEAQIKKDIDTTARLGSDRHVMAATTPIPEAAKSLAQMYCAETGIKLVLLERDDLRA